MRRAPGYKAVITIVLMAWVIASMVQADISPETAWADPTRVQLNVEFPGDGYHASWELFRCDCGDLLVRSELNVPGEVEKGESVLVEGRAVLSRGFGDHQAELGSSLDAPALMMQLALRLLERSEPGGPSRISATREVDLLDEINHIHLDTYSAVGGFKAPWSISGTIAPAGENQRRFDLRFTFTIAGATDVQESSMRLEGVADFASTDFPLNGSDSIADWNLTWRDENDASAQQAGTVSSLDELRALIRNTP